MFSPELTPALIQQITRIKQCPSCAIFRRRHINIKKGSGAYPAAAEAYFTIDEWGPYPPDSMGNIYCHSAMCSGTGFIFGELAKNKVEDLYQMEYDLLQFNKALGHKLVSIRVDAGTGVNSKEFNAIAADFGGYVNSCDKERQRRNPIESGVRPITAIASIQLSEAVYVSKKEWGSSLLHSFDINNAFPNKRSKFFGDGTMSPLEAFTGWKPDMSKWHKLGTVGTAEKIGYVRKFDEPHRIAVWVGATKKPGIKDYCVFKGERGMKRVTNFQPLCIGVIRQTEMEKEALLKQPFPVAGGTEIVSLESLRDLVQPEVDYLGELLEVPHNRYLYIKQPFEPRITRSSKKIEDSITQRLEIMEKNNNIEEDLLPIIELL